ncbi:MAG: ComEC/Rec2 family competence protein [Bacteroidales bacterium]|nr:ComEC/Rec2 family competence protein [Bacteroidales bacterium]
MHSDLSEEIRKYPFIRITIPFIIGIILSLISSIPSTVCAIGFFAAFILYLIFYFSNKFSQFLATGILINLTIVFAGAFLSSIKAEYAQTSLENIKQGLIIGEIDKDPNQGEKTTSLEISILAVNANNIWNSAEGKTLLYIENSEESAKLKPGDKLIFSPQLSEIENKGNPEEFDYKQYLAYNLILSTDYLKSDDWQLLSSNHDIGLRHKFLRFRQSLISKLKKYGLDNEELSVASALALGYKDSLSDEIRHAYSSSGAMHILAVSGLHVGIVYGIIIFLLSFIKYKKLDFLKVILTIALVWIYAILTGLSPSVSRAALMFSILALGKLQKHPSGSLNAIAASAFILLIINPYNLTNIGFQLSYIAVIGIVLMYEPLYRMIEIKNKFVDKIWSLTAVSVAAQLATAPICLLYFHQFSNYFLLTNYLLIPISTVAIWLVISVFLFSGIDIIASFLAKILAWLISAMNQISFGIENLPFSVSRDIYISWPQMIFMYIAIISFFIFFFQTKKYKHLVIGILSVIIFTSISLFDDFVNKDQKYFIVYNINKTTAVNLIDGKNNILFANVDSVSVKNIEFSAKNNWLKKGLNQEKYIDLSSGKESVLSNIASINNPNIFFKKKFISFNDLRVFILDDSFNSLILEDGFKKIKVDYIVLSNSPALKLEEIHDYFEFKSIIIDSSNSQRQIELWNDENISLQFDIYNVKLNGAFICEL